MSPVAPKNLFRVLVCFRSEMLRQMAGMLAFLLVSAGAVLFLAPTVDAQTAPSLKPAFSGAIAVAGAAARGVHEVSIYDLSYLTEKKLGTSSSVDRNGNFVVVVKPPLIVGHQIVAVDSFGSKSNVMVVAAPPKGTSIPPRARP